ncbi:hypothetical protein ACSBR2_020985 [Camellia fascicularis]
MPERNCALWNTMIDGYNKQYIDVLAIFNEMNSHGISYDEVTMATVISACAHIGALNLGKEIYLYVMQNEFDRDAYLGSALVDMYEKNLFYWNSIIEGLAVHGYAEEALAIFSRMEGEKKKPNGLVEENHRRFLNMTCDFSIPPEIQHYECMVDLFGCKLYKNLEIAQVAVNKLMVLEPNNSGCYTLLVNMYAESNQ